ncbi:proteasome subunit beta [Candidatus Marsarchaeota archaeon]|nr:proteasome subunit beta [Candidatus Marsarchaeota archaeon]
MEPEIGKYMKGTTTIGVVCGDGVVLGVDSRATAGNIIASTEARKVFKIDANMGMTIAGTVGDAQELVRVLKAQNEVYKMNEGRPLNPKSAASLLSIILQQNKMMPYLAWVLVGGVDGSSPLLYSVDPLGGAIEETRFTSVGSGSESALGYIEEAYKKGMPTKDAVKMVAKALSVAMRRDSASGDSMIIAVINGQGYTEYSGKEIEKVTSSK